MTKYVVISDHPPSACPSGNPTTRRLAEDLPKELGSLSQKHSVKVDTVLHLDPGHKILMVFEAQGAEHVRDFIYESGLSRWNSFEFHMASSMEEIMSWTGKLPTIW